VAERTLRELIEIAKADPGSLTAAELGTLRGLQARQSRQPKAAAGPAPDVITSLRAAAKAIGRSPSTMRKWLSRRDWPFGRGPFNIEQLRKWMELHLRRDPAQRYHDAQKGIDPREVTELERVRAWSYEESARTRQIKRKELENQLHDVEECRVRRRRQILAVRNTLTRTLPRTLAADLVGRARGDAERVIRDRLKAVCDRFAEESDGQA
jgi:hypothetical protein